MGSGVTGAVLASCGSLVVGMRGRALLLTPQDDGRTIAKPVGDFNGPGARIEVRPGKALLVEEKSLAWARQAIALAGGESRYAGKT